MQRLQRAIVALLMGSSFVQPTFAGGESAEDREIEAFVMGGTGRTSSGNSIGNQGGQFSIHKNIDTRSKVAVMYFNEGTAENNHRDGFAVMGWRNWKMTDNISFEGGLGPYLSMNTMTVDGQQLNKKNLGAMAAIAVLYRIHGTNFKIRAQYAHVAMPRAEDTDTIFAGVGYAFGERAPKEEEKTAEAPSGIDASVWAGNSQTTRAGAEMSKGFQVEVKRIASEHVAYSVAIIKEGDSKVTDRTGIVGQVWYAVQTDNGWNFSVGAGPYIARDAKTGKTRLMSAASMRVMKDLTKTVKIGFTFNRLLSGIDEDQDMFLIGVYKEF